MVTVGRPVLEWGARRLIRCGYWKGIWIDIDEGGREMLKEQRI